MESGIGRWEGARKPSHMGDSVDTEKWEGERMGPKCFSLKARYNSMTDWLRTEEGSPGFWNSLGNAE